LITIERELKSTIDEIYFYLNKIDSVSYEQLRVLKEGDVTQLNVLLDRKDELIKRVGNLHLTLNSRLEKDKDKLQDYKEECFREINGIEAYLKRIISNEHKCLKKTMQSKDTAFSEIKQIANGKRVIRSYKSDNVSNKFEKNWQG